MADLRISGKKPMWRRTSRRADSLTTIDPPFVVRFAPNQSPIVDRAGVRQDKQVDGLIRLKNRG